jgi:hypothetical protein
MHSYVNMLGSLSCFGAVGFLQRRQPSRVTTPKMLDVPGRSPVSVGFYVLDTFEHRFRRTSLGERFVELFAGAYAVYPVTTKRIEQPNSLGASLVEKRQEIVPL